ncbi:hypothetical protein KC19_12G027000 [Ceratodon purpureus]|uniref:Protein kinase domain-containing protein n=1 Tax=Ceratodon purpureus TaxID=3225 RepID=A0A8T0G2U5_CERPU|nr:hypothetical protein KC19_12G027000 [Ceratodon purpureus]
MAFGNFRKKLSNSLKAKTTEVGNSSITGGQATPSASGENPQFYLRLTTQCTKKVQSMVASASLKFNIEQCMYLAHKLEKTERSAYSYHEQTSTWYSKFASDEEYRERSLEICKLVFALSQEVETFILGCSGEAWVQSAILLAVASDVHIASLGFHLEFCTIVLSNRKAIGGMPVLTDAAITRLRNAEADCVERLSYQDQLRLHRDLRALMTRSRESGGADEEPISVLLEKLKYTTPISSANSTPEANQLDSRPEIRMRSLKQIAKLGSGSFGDVHKMNWLGFEVARKTFPGSSASDFEQEVQILEGLCHPNIVSLLGYTRDARNCYMIMELMDDDLYSLMQERLENCGTGDPPFSISEAVHMMLQVAEGMLFLHEKSIVHRDLKSRNILVKRLKATEVGIKTVHVKVADFGLSRTKEKSRTYSTQTLNQGTTRWMAPEMIKLANEDGHVESHSEEVLKYPFKVDVYSFGMVCFEILTGDMPFPSLTTREVKRKVLGGERPQLPDDCPERLRCLIEACWSPKPDERPGFDYICAELRHLKCAHYVTSTWTKAFGCFSLEEIQRMTNNFHNHLGGKQVYEGVMVNTGEVVAVKRRYALSVSESASENFSVEMAVLPQLHHKNVVGYAGFCLEKGERILVFEYMPSGSLDKWLFDDARKVSMTWRVRRNICLGVATGIQYLHSVSEPRFVHRDIKPGHILLDQNLEPKIADFSMAYLLPDDESVTEVDRVAGTSGYMAPEDRVNGELSQKCDVYSFGVVLLEIVRGSTCISNYIEKMHALQVWVLQLALESHSDALGRICELIDPTLNLEPDEEIEAVRIMKIALLCLQSSPVERPDMGLVVEMLHGRLDVDISSLNTESSFRLHSPTVSEWFSSDEEEYMWLENDE